MIKFNQIGLGLTIVASLVSIYLFLYESKVEWLLPAVLGFGGIAFNSLFRTGKITSESHGTNILVYTGIAVLGIGVGGFLSNTVPALPSFITTMQLTPYDTIIFASIMAITEEAFFRGGFFNFLLKYIPFTVALPIQAFVFSFVYHAKVYGTQPNALLFVFIAGIVLGYVAYASKTITACQFGHIINNIIGGLR